MRLHLGLGAAALLAVALAVPAYATGEGRYLVEGQGPGGANPYRGVPELTQAGQGTWRIHWQIGAESWEGSGIGDMQAFAVTFFSGSQAGTALYVSDGKGGYRGIWAGLGPTQVGVEALTPAQQNPQK